MSLVSFRPDFSQHREDPRFDRYRGRVGQLLRDGEDVGWVLVQVEPYSRQVGGHLWWSRWGRTQDLLSVWYIVNGNFSDAVVPDEFSENELRDYDAGRFAADNGDTLSLVWLNPEESKRVRASQFGV